MHHCKMHENTVEGRERRMFPSCLRCFYSAHIHLLDDTLLINVVTIIKGDVFIGQEDLDNGVFYLNYKRIPIQGKIPNVYIYITNLS